MEDRYCSIDKGALVRLGSGRIAGMVKHQGALSVTLSSGLTVKRSDVNWNKKYSCFVLEA